MFAAHEQRAAKERERLLLVGVLTTGASLAPTAYAALIGNAVILVADLLRCAVEFLAILLAWIIVRRTTRSDVTRYAFGFGKLEELSSIAVALAMLASCAVVAVTALLRFREPVPAAGTAFGFAFAFASLAGNIVMWRMLRAASDSAPSPVVHAQRRLFRAKAAASTVVFVSLLPGIVAPGVGALLYVDPLGSLVLAGLLLVSAIELLSSSMRGLVDSSIEESLQLRLLGTLIAFESEYRGLGPMRTRRSGNRVFVELALQFDPATAIGDFELLANRMRTELAAAIPNLDLTIVPYSAPRER